MPCAQAGSTGGSAASLSLSQPAPYQEAGRRLVEVARRALLCALMLSAADAPPGHPRRLPAHLLRVLEPCWRIGLLFPPDGAGGRTPQYGEVASRLMPTSVSLTAGRSSIRYCVRLPGRGFGPQFHLAMRATIIQRPAHLYNGKSRTICYSEPERPPGPPDGPINGNVIWARLDSSQVVVALSVAHLVLAHTSTSLVCPSLTTGGIR